MLFYYNQKLQPGAFAGKLSIRGRGSQGSRTAIASQGLAGSAGALSRRAAGALSVRGGAAGADAPSGSLEAREGCGREDSASDSTSWAQRKPTLKLRKPGRLLYR